jgi:hypothetical protein
MPLERTVYPTDTTTAIEKLIEHLNTWKQDNPKANPREVALVITKLEEAAHWSLFMVKRD